MDFAEEDDVELLTNCYVTLHATGKLGSLLEAHGVKPKLQIDVFNDTLDHDAAVLSEDDVDAQIALLRVWIEKPTLMDGLLEELQVQFGHLTLN